MNQKVSIDHINMSVNNLNDSLLWYKKLFQFEMVEQGVSEGEPWAILKKDQAHLCLYQSPGKTEAPEEDQFHRISHFGLNISSKEQWEVSVKENKIKVMYGGAIRYPHSYSWYVVDPSGHEIEVSHWDNGNELVF